MWHYINEAQLQIITNHGAFRQSNRRNSHLNHNMFNVITIISSNNAYLQYTHSISLSHNVLDLLVVAVPDLGGDGEHLERIAFVDVLHSTFEHLCRSPESLLAVAKKFIKLKDVILCYCHLLRDVYFQSQYLDRQLIHAR